MFPIEYNQHGNVLVIRSDLAYMKIWHHMFIEFASHSKIGTIAVTIYLIKIDTILLDLCCIR